MAQSLENKFLTNGSGLGFPNNPTQPIPAGVGPSPAAKGSTLHDLYSYDGNPNSSKVDPRFINTSKTGVASLPAPTGLQVFTGPSNLLAAGAGFNQYSSLSTYDTFILGQGAI
jgi:hypothetical protein|tara:strand:- start:240 stop:578 length:339 start_codon:yes stop_codon:yes gene_type:complete